jgi:aryl-alcohol dehydrogenase-like predicted oxidoreductase
MRTLGRTNLEVTPVAMGCWPIAGITSVDVTEADSLRTLEAAVDAGINFFDTAYAYGYDGESERMIRRALGYRRDELVIATKCGISWGPDRRQIRDGRPETIRRQCEESLSRLGTDRIDLYYLHAPDPETPVADSAGAMRELLEAGKIRAVGVSNFESPALYEQFQAVCPITASQPHYNMLQREIEAEVLPWCVERRVSAVVYWPLMKGFLAGKLRRDHQWDPRDGRRKYPIFQGSEWTKTHDFLDRLRVIAGDVGCTVAQLVVAWTIQRPGVTAALCGAKRPEQIFETAAAMEIHLDPATLAVIDEAIEQRGPLPSRSAVS